MLKGLKGRISAGVLVALAIMAIMAIIASFLGCDDGMNPVQPVEEVGLPSTASTVGQLKSASDAASAVTAEGVEVVFAGSSVAAAPSIVKQINGTTLKISLSHKETEDGGDEVVIITATSGNLVGKDKIRFYADGDYIGRVTLPTNASLSELHIRLDDEDLTDDEVVEVVIEVEISRNGRIIADAEITLERAPAVTSPRLEKVEVGDSNEIILVFSKDVNAYRAVKSNVRVVIDGDADGDALSIRTYAEDGDEITLVMRKNLVAGQYTITYNSKGGLEDMNGEGVEEFWSTFTVAQDNGGTAVGKVVPVWKTIPHGLYRSGDEILNLLTAVYAVSDWTKEIMGTVMFPIEPVRGNTDLIKIRIADLGVRGTLTLEKIIAAVVASDDYDLVPAEAGPILRLMYIDQPVGESLLVASHGMRRPGVNHELYGLYLGGGNDVQTKKNINAIETSAGLDSTEFRQVVVGKK